MSNFHGRKKPYTEIGIRRVSCSRCGKKPSLYSWSSCANGNHQMPLCAECDIALNELVLKFFRFANRKRLMADYRERVGEESLRVISA